MLQGRDILRVHIARSKDPSMGWRWRGRRWVKGGGKCRSEQKGEPSALRVLGLHRSSGIGAHHGFKCIFNRVAALGDVPDSRVIGEAGPEVPEIELPAPEAHAKKGDQVTVELEGVVEQGLAGTEGERTKSANFGGMLYVPNRASRRGAFFHIKINL